MKIRYLSTSVFMIAMLMLCVHTVFAQNENKPKISIASTVEDSDGNPIANAELISDNSYAKTGNDGSFTISVNPDASLTVKAGSYKSITLSASEASEMTNITLPPSDSLDNKIVNLGFRKVSESELVSAVSYMTADEFGNDKTRIMGGGAVGDIAGYRMVGLLGGLNVRGLGIGMDVGSLLSGGLFSSPAMIVVDGIPRDLDYLRISEIESITVLKDANAAVLYGTSAVNGVILVTTKRAKDVKKNSDITVRYGISTPTAFPKYMNSYDYMNSYNLAYQNDGNEDPYYDQEQLSNFKSGNKYRYPILIIIPANF